ncbi:MAG TPA: hypothetical protein DIC42_03560 [Holosporales bacterium]|nr:hypothetical protein [Holosporales bacterium]
MKIVLGSILFLITNVSAATYQIYGENGELQTSDSYGCFSAYLCADAQGTVSPNPANNSTYNPYCVLMSGTLTDPAYFSHLDTVIINDDTTILQDLLIYGGDGGDGGDGDAYRTRSPMNISMILLMNGLNLLPVILSGMKFAKAGIKASQTLHKSFVVALSQAAKKATEASAKKSALKATEIAAKQGIFNQFKKSISMAVIDFLPSTVVKKFGSQSALAAKKLLAISTKEGSEFLLSAAGKKGAEKAAQKALIKAQLQAVKTNIKNNLQRAAAEDLSDYARRHLMQQALTKGIALQSTKMVTIGLDAADGWVANAADDLTRRFADSVIDTAVSKSAQELLIDAALQDCIEALAKKFTLKNNIKKIMQGLSSRVTNLLPGGLVGTVALRSSQNLRDKYLRKLVLKEIAVKKIAPLLFSLTAQCQGGGGGGGGFGWIESSTIKGVGLNVTNGGVGFHPDGYTKSGYGGRGSYGGGGGGGGSVYETVTGPWIVNRAGNGGNAAMLAGGGGGGGSGTGKGLSDWAEADGMGGNGGHAAASFVNGILVLSSGGGGGGGERASSFIYTIAEMVAEIVVQIKLNASIIFAPLVPLITMVMKLFYWSNLLAIREGVQGGDAHFQIQGDGGSFPGGFQFPMITPCPVVSRNVNPNNDSHLTNSLNYGLVGQEGSYGAAGILVKNYFVQQATGNKLDCVCSGAGGGGGGAGSVGGVNGRAGGNAIQHFEGGTGGGSGGGAFPYPAGEVSGIGGGGSGGDGGSATEKQMNVSDTQMCTINSMNGGHGGRGFVGGDGGQGGGWFVILPNKIINFGLPQSTSSLVDIMSSVANAGSSPQDSMFGMIGGASGKNGQNQGGAGGNGGGVMVIYGTTNINPFFNFVITRPTPTSASSGISGGYACVKAGGLLNIYNGAKVSTDIVVKNGGKLMIEELVYNCDLTEIENPTASRIINLFGLDINSTNPVNITIESGGKFYCGLPQLNFSFVPGADVNTIDNGTNVFFFHVLNDDVATGTTPGVLNAIAKLNLAVLNICAPFEDTFYTATRDTTVPYKFENQSQTLKTLSQNTNITTINVGSVTLPSGTIYNGYVNGTGLTLSTTQILNVLSGGTLLLPSNMPSNMINQIKFQNGSAVATAESTLAKISSLSYPVGATISLQTNNVIQDDSTGVSCTLSDKVKTWNICGGSSTAPQKATTLSSAKFQTINVMGNTVPTYNPETITAGYLDLDGATIDDAQTVTIHEAGTLVLNKPINSMIRPYLSIKSGASIATTVTNFETDIFNGLDERFEANAICALETSSILADDLGGICFSGIPSNLTTWDIFGGTTSSMQQATTLKNAQFTTINLFTPMHTTALTLNAEQTFNVYNTLTIDGSASNLNGVISVQPNGTLIIPNTITANTVGRLIQILFGGIMRINSSLTSTGCFISVLPSGIIETSIANFTTTNIFNNLTVQSNVVLQTNAVLSDSADGVSSSNMPSTVTVWNMQAGTANAPQYATQFSKSKFKTMNVAKGGYLNATGLTIEPNQIINVFGTVFIPQNAAFLPKDLSGTTDPSTTIYIQPGAIIKSNLTNDLFKTNLLKYLNAPSDMTITQSDN